MIDRIKGWLGTGNVAPVQAASRPAPIAPPPPGPPPSALASADKVALSAPAPARQPAAQVEFSFAQARPTVPTRPVQGRVAEMNTADPQFQALLGRLFGDVRVASPRKA